MISPEEIVSRRMIRRDSTVANSRFGIGGADIALPLLRSLSLLLSPQSLPRSIKWSRQPFGEDLCTLRQQEFKEQFHAKMAENPSRLYVSGEFD